MRDMRTILICQIGQLAGGSSSAPWLEVWCQRLRHKKENEVDMEEDELTMVELKRVAHTHMDHIENEYDYPSIHTELGVLVLA